jgi:hypothetical protein
MTSFFILLESNDVLAMLLNVPGTVVDRSLVPTSIFPIFKPLCFLSSHMRHWREGKEYGSRIGLLEENRQVLL